MAAVLEQLARVHEATETEAVHDLRVAIRRCRAVAAAMREVDPHPAWRAMRREARSLFRALGALRDAQVLEEWVEKVTPADNPVRQAYLDTLKAREGEAVAQVRMAIQAFDLAEFFQTPVFVMTDLDLGMNNWMADPFEYPTEPIRRGKVLTVEDLNRLGASVGAMAQANADQGSEGIAASDFRTMEALGKRVAEAAQRWQEQPLAVAA